MSLDLSLVLAGAEVLTALQAEKEARVQRAPSGLFKSEPLCRLQEEQARRGILGANLVKSIYGWSVRYDSGLQKWALIASSRYGQVDGSFEDAVRAARAWHAQDPARRYVCCPEAARELLQAVTS